MTRLGVKSPSAHVWLLLALIPFAAIAGHRWNWGVPEGYGDHAQYLSHARAIVEGRSYTDIGYIYHPALPTLGPRAYPPGLPLTLAPIVAVAGTDTRWIQVLMIVTVLVFALVAYRRLALVLAPWQAAMSVGVSVLAVASQYGTVVPLSDPGLCAVLWGLILAVDTATSWTWKRVAVVTSLGFAAMAYRVPGVIVVPALALYGLMTWREHRGGALIPALIWSVAGLLLLASGLVEAPLGPYLMPRADQIAGRVTSMIGVYRPALFDLELYPFRSDRLNDSYHAAASVALVGGTGALLWRYRRTMMTSTVIMYVALLSVSPVTDGRYVWPLYPVLAGGFVIGATAASRMIGRYAPLYPRSAAPVALVLALVMLATISKESQVPVPRSLDRLPDATSLFAWMRNQHSRQPMRATFYNPRVLTLETRVPAMGALLAPPAELLMAIRDFEITHMVWQQADASSCRARLLNALPTTYPDRFVLEYENPTFRVYRVESRGSALSDARAASVGIADVCGVVPRY